MIQEQLRERLIAVLKHDLGIDHEPIKQLSSSEVQQARLYIARRPFKGVPVYIGVYGEQAHLNDRPYPQMSPATMYMNYLLSGGHL